MVLKTLKVEINLNAGHVIELIERILLLYVLCV